MGLQNEVSKSCNYKSPAYALRPGSIVITCYGRGVAALTDNRGMLLKPERLYKVLLSTICSDHTFSDHPEQHLLKIAVLLQLSQSMRNH